MAQKKDKRDEAETETKKPESAASAIEGERSTVRALGGTLSAPPQSERKLAESEHPERRSTMAADERAERAQQDYKDMAKTWKNGYLSGLEAVLQWQGQNERLFKDTVKQGFSGSRQLLAMWRDWTKRQTEEQQRTQERAQEQMGMGDRTTNPMLGLTRQSTEALVATVEPILKNSEAAMDSSFGYYETAIAAPSRRYVREINRQVLDAIIPG